MVYVAIRSQHKFMLRLHVAILCCDLMLRSDVHISVGFSVFAGKDFSIFGILHLPLSFSVRFPRFRGKVFLKIGILHLQLPFLVGFPISQIYWLSQTKPTGQNLKIFLSCPINTINDSLT